MTTTPPPPAQPHPARDRAAPDGTGRMLTAAQVAALLGGRITARTVRAYWRTWQLPAYRVGKHLRWKEHEVKAWIDTRRA